MTRRAQRKKLGRKFKVGDVVTWGRGLVAHRVVEVTELGVIVDATSCGFGLRLIEFAPGSKHVAGPPSHSDLEPDRKSSAQ